MFDLKKLELNRLKNHKLIENSKFYSFISEDIIDRLEPINKSYKKILIINLNFASIETIKFENKFAPANISYWQYPSENEDISQKFDLIIFPFGMHWVTDVRQLLAKAKFLLKSDGILISNFAGGGSLNALRRILIQLETEHQHPHTPHISPFIQFEHVTPLLQQAGFNENIIDMESFELEYDSPLELMRSIKNVGQANALSGATGYSITKAMFNSLKNFTPANFTDQLNIITFVSSSTKNSVKLKAEYFNPAPRI